MTKPKFRTKPSRKIFATDWRRENSKVDYLTPVQSESPGGLQGSGERSLAQNRHQGGTKKPERLKMHEKSVRTGKIENGKNQNAKYFQGILCKELDGGCLAKQF